MPPQIVILQALQFCHVLNQQDGIQRLEVGPCRLVLESNESIHGKVRSFTVLKEGQFVRITNPVDPENVEAGNQMGHYVCRRGPQTFPLYPNEVQGKISDAWILNESEALKVKASRDFEGRRAGEIYRISGPAKFTPRVEETVIEKLTAYQIGQNQAIYVQNTVTAELRMVRGPVAYLLSANEEFYRRRLPHEQATALGIEGPSGWAPVVNLQKCEALAVIDYRANKEKYVIGPTTYLLGPYEGVKVCSLSAGRPKRENQYTVAVLRLGPDFFLDLVTVRTRDNALLQLDLTYRWQFLVDTAHSNVARVFSCRDFVGYSSQSLRSRIREVAALYDFEHFQANAQGLLRQALLKDRTHATGDCFGLLFRDCELLISEIHLNACSPLDTDIARLLEAALKANMRIICEKNEKAAQNQAEIEQIQSLVEIEQLRSTLILAENDNFRKVEMDSAQVAGETLIEEARAAYETAQLTETVRVESEVAELREKLDMLNLPGAESYLDYLAAKSMASIEEIRSIPEVNKLALQEAPQY